MASKYTAPVRHRVFVKEWLKAKKMNQTELADAMGTDKANVSRWISQPWRIDLDVISGMEIAMRLRPGDLFRHPRDVENLRRQQEALEVIRRLPTDRAS